MAGGWGERGRGLSKEDWYKLKRQPIVSAALVIANGIVFLLYMFGSRSLYEWGGLDVIGVLWRKEYWRVAASLFLHGSVNHLFNNMIILFFLGSIIEQEFGHIKYAILYFLSGISGNILSLCSSVMTGSLSYSVGASGAVFGLDGALLAIVLLGDRRVVNVNLPRVLLMIGLSVYSGFTGENIDNAAHIGGLAAGFVIGCVFCLIKKSAGRAGDERTA